MTAKEAMAELWGTFCPDCGPEEYAGILAEVAKYAPAPDPEAGLRALETELRREAEEHRWYAGVPCQCENSAHANDYNQWASTIAAYLASRTPRHELCPNCGLEPKLAEEMREWKDNEGVTPPEGGR